MKEDNDSKLVATIAATSPIAFDTAMETVSTPAEVDKDSPEGNEDSPWANVQVSQEEPEEIQDPESGEPELPVEPEQPKDLPPSNLDKFSDAAIAARVLKERRPDLFEEVTEDMEWDFFIENVDKYIAQTLEAGKSYQLEQIGETNKYVQFLLEGGDPDILREATQFNSLASVDLEKAEEEHFEQIIRADYGLREIPEEDIEEIIERAKVKGNLKDKASYSQGNLQKREETLMLQDQQRRLAEQQRMKQQQERLTNEINATIDKNEVLGFRMDDKTRQELRDMIFKPTTIIEFEQNGQTVTQKVPEFIKLKQDFDQNIEQQVAFALLLKRGFDFSSMLGETERKKNDDLMEELRRRSGRQSLPRVSNKYLE